MKVALKNDTVILLLTHFIDDLILEEFRKIRSDVVDQFDTYLIYNTTEESSPACIPDDINAFRFHQKDLPMFHTFLHLHRLGPFWN